MKTVTIPLTIGGGGMGTPIAYNTFNPTTGTIDTGNATLTVKDVVSIFNATTGHWLYKPDAAPIGNVYMSKSFDKITIASGVITYTAELSGLHATDELVILVRS
jgi:hypothetical protein